MTAVNVIVQSRAVHLLTDGAMQYPDGTLLSLTSKVMPLPYIRAAVATRGPTYFLGQVTDFIAATCLTFDETRSALPRLLRSNQSQQHARDFDAVIAGFSETEGPQAYIITNHRLYPAIEPFSALALGPVSLMPSDEAIAGKLRLWETGSTGDAFDPVADGIRMMEAQRGWRGVLPGGSMETGAVGGFVQLTTVTPESVATRIIHRWPDVFKPLEEPAP